MGVYQPSEPRPVRLQIRESMEGGVMVVGLSEITVRSAAEALQLLRVGTSHRAVAETASNPVSSRSHCILTLHMEARDKMDTGVVRIRRSRLQLVDLAGSERTAKGVDYGSARQKETNAINKSLSTLGLVIARLTDRTRSQGPVPYRDSKLTFLLQDCLGGNAKTLIIANLNPSPTCSAETNMTLGFALRAKRVRNRAVVNEDHQGDAIILQGEVRRLREELSIFRTLHAKDGPPQGIEELSAWRDQAAARVSQLHQALQLNGELEEKIAKMEAAHSRLRMEHAVLEEQCEAQRCEMSALEATVEQCEDELHELRTRPSLEQLQALQDQLQEALRERDEARAHHADALRQNLQLHDQCTQLTGLLESYQRQNQTLGTAPGPVPAEPTEAQGAEASPLHHSGEGERYTTVYPAAEEEEDKGEERQGELVLQSVEEGDYVTLVHAYTELKTAYTALVEQNRQLLEQLETAAGILESASAREDVNEDGEEWDQRRDEEGEGEEEASRRSDRLDYEQRHRYHLAESFLISGGLEAVIESTDELYGDEEQDHGGESRGPRQARAATAEVSYINSPSEQVRFASPTSLGHEAVSALPGAVDDVATRPPLSAGSYRNESHGSRAFNLMRTRCCGKRHGDAVTADAIDVVSAVAAAAAAAAARANVTSGVVRRRSMPESWSLDGDEYNKPGSIPSYCNLTRFRPVGFRQVQSAREAEQRTLTRPGDSDDATDVRSRGTLVRVNPLFDCRANSDDGQFRTASSSRNNGGGNDDEAVEVGTEVTSAPQQSSASAAATAGSGSVVCELPMPPDEQQIIQTSARYSGSLAIETRSKGGRCCSDGDTDSTTGVLQEEDVAGPKGSLEASITSGPWERVLQQHSPTASVLAVVELRQNRKRCAGLQGEPSFMETPCSHPQSLADSCGPAGVKPLAHSRSPSRNVVPAAGSMGLNNNGEKTPASPESTFGGFMGGGGAVAAVIPNPPYNVSATSDRIGGGALLDHSAASKGSNSVSRPAALQESSFPLQSSNNKNKNYTENISVLSNNNTGRFLRASGASIRRDRLIGGVVACTTQSPSCVTGTNGPSPQGFRSSAQYRPRHVDVLTHGIGTRATPTHTQSPGESPYTTSMDCRNLTGCSRVGAPVFNVLDNAVFYASNGDSSDNLSARSRSKEKGASPATSCGLLSVPYGGGVAVGGGGLSSGSRSAGASPVMSRTVQSWMREEQLEENVAQLEEELARRLQGEMQLRIKLQDALTEGQSAAAQAANLLALNNGMIEEIAERDERLRAFEELVSRLYGELKAILRQGSNDSESPVQLTAMAAKGASSSPVAAVSFAARMATSSEGKAATADVPENSEPVTISPTERPRLIQSFETDIGSNNPLGCLVDGGSTPQNSASRCLDSARDSASLSVSQGSRGGSATSALSPLCRLIGSARLEGPSSAMRTGLMMLLAKLRDELLDRDQRLAGLEEELAEARSRQQRVEKELQKLQDAWQQALLHPGVSPDGDITPSVTDVDIAADVDVKGAAIGTTFDARAPPDVDRIDEHGFIAPPSPACSDTDPHLQATWSGGSQDPPGLPHLSSPLESSLRREASLQAQLHSRDCQVFELLERNEMLEASLQATVVDRDNRIAELQSHATRLAGNLQSQLWRRDMQVSEMQSRVSELDSSLQRTTAEAVRFRQQMTEAVDQCERYALELRGLERREELLMGKLRALEMSLMHRAQEMEAMRGELTNSLEQLSGMRAKAMAAEVDAAHARQTAASLEDQLEDLHRKMGLLQQPQLTQTRPQKVAGPAPYTVATIRPTISGAGVMHPAPAVAPWRSDGVGVSSCPTAHLPNIYTARSDGSTVEGLSVTYPVPSLPPLDYGPIGSHDMVGSMPALGVRPIGRSSRNTTYSQGPPAVASGKVGPGHGYSKGGGGSRGYNSVSAGVSSDHGAANKGTWVQRFLCRKGVSPDGSPGQEAHVAILTPAKWRTKGMTGIVLRQWVGQGSGKNGTRISG
ncbi:hypothetical protein Vafri_19218 [Volvox africanus]|uniref:Kinesin motor domain-containing protein n=1 Tax=Volvox africanus TaxID=51714 RepID=A0A8J4BPC1_9CHLO|nr:hypothetical protein Vafri_19218 [Volvox africanus]